MIQLQNCIDDSSSSFEILYDGMIYQRQAAGGINRYFEKLISNLPDKVMPSMAVTRIRCNNFPTHPNLRLYLKRFELPKPFRKLGRAILANRFKSIQDEIHPNLVHATYYDSLTGCEKPGRTPLVVTVHDMTHEIIPELVDRRGRHAAIKKRAIERADAVICVSHKTREDLLNLYPGCESKTTVIHHATELGQCQPDNWQPANTRPYFLYVGSRVTYKNFGRLLRAFAKITSKHPDVQLRTVGAAFTDKESAQIAELGLQDHVVGQGFVTDARLARLYRSSVALVYPSLYEGFGLPLLEAMSCDTPVLAANCSCIPEVVEDAALLFDPKSESQLTEGLEVLLRDQHQRESLVLKGRTRCQNFSWAKTANRTVGVYESVVAMRNAKYKINPRHVEPQLRSVPETRIAS